MDVGGEGPGQPLDEGLHGGHFLLVLLLGGDLVLGGDVAHDALGNVVDDADDDAAARVGTDFRCRDFLQ